MEVFGIRLIGFDLQTLHKLILSAAFLAGIIALRYVWVLLSSVISGKHPNGRFVFWTKQVTSLITAFLFIVVLASIWFNNSGQLAAGIGLLTGGLAFALQKVITSIAGYIVIMRGKTFSVGERIMMDSVRGDVISLGFMQTRIMEMGKTPDDASAQPGAWVESLQYTGRIVSLTNDKVFESPIYNYTREFPYIWEEMTIPIPVKANRKRAEEILIEAAQKSGGEIQKYSAEEQRKIEERYFIPFKELDPQVYYRITSKWLELHLRFLTPFRDVRNIRDEISRYIVDRFEAEGIEIGEASSK